MHPVISAVLVMAMTLAPADSGPSRADGAEARLLKLINADRISSGLPSLEWNSILAGLARDHAADMARSGMVKHTSSTDGADFVQRLGRTELRASAAAENIALDRNADTTHESLMSSPLHRANILDPDLVSIGIGVVEDPNLEVIYVVQDFAAPIDGLSAEGAVGMVRKAISKALEKAILPPTEDRALSRLLAKDLKLLVDADSVDIGEKGLGAPGWMIAYTTFDPSRLPDDARFRVQLADSYAFAVTFARTKSYPLGIYWVLLSLRSVQDELTTD